MRDECVHPDERLKPLETKVYSLNYLSIVVGRVYLFAYLDVMPSDRLGSVADDADVHVII